MCGRLPSTPVCRGHLLGSVARRRSIDGLVEGRASPRKLSALSFDAAGFGHGGPIARDASTRFQKSGATNRLPDIADTC